MILGKSKEAELMLDWLLSGRVAKCVMGDRKSYLQGDEAARGELGL